MHGHASDGSTINNNKNHTTHVRCSNARKHLFTPAPFLFTVSRENKLSSPLMESKQSKHSIMLFPENVHTPSMKRFWF